MITTLHRRGERYLRLKFGLPIYKDESDHEHTALLDAVRRRDIATARTLVAEHLLGSGELLYRFLTERAQAEAAQAKLHKPRTRRARTPTGS
jgi:DNA-binding GntR family transcriptional regulator